MIPVYRKGTDFNKPVLPGINMGVVFANERAETLFAVFLVHPKDVIGLPYNKAVEMSAKEGLLKYRSIPEMEREWVAWNLYPLVPFDWTTETK